jgi:hypothetical protein
VARRQKLETRNYKAESGEEKGVAGWRQESWSEGVGPAAGGLEDGEDLDVTRAEAVDDGIGCAGDDEFAGGGGAAFAAGFGMGLEGFHSGKDGFDEAVGGGDVVLCDVVACGAEMMERPGRPAELQRRRHFLTMFLTWA